MYGHTRKLRHRNLYVNLFDLALYIEPRLAQSTARTLDHDEAREQPTALREAEASRRS
jgi:hypothetical protein